MTQFVTLGIDRETFALPVEAVREILDMCEISKLPNAPPQLLGMIDVRGAAVPVIDLRTKFGLPRIDSTPNTRILVLEFVAQGRKTSIGLVADRVFEVTGLDGDRLDPAPETGCRWQSDHIAGIGRRGDRFVVVLDLARLLADDTPTLITTALEAA
ncbi:chemotaxis protein CheW [Hyphomicrobium sp.]|uniref:chemotaxis protein CheW n=1 Tax=Hyphomicrobium sp. TaxID=82 RepID=UPI003F717D1C